MRALMLVILSGIVSSLYSSVLHDVALSNIIGQFVIFLLVASIPCALTERMSYVDMAWPYGLVYIGVQFLLRAHDMRHILCGLVYLLSGGRMALGATMMWLSGKLKKEFARYEYQRLHWARKGVTSVSLHMQYDLWMQAIANCSVLFLPGAIMNASYMSNSRVTLIEYAGFGSYLLFFTLEMIADYQKDTFARKCKAKKLHKAVCNVGLWQYSRHPNYFCEWMVWNSILCMSLPSMYFMFHHEKWIIAVPIAMNVLGVSAAMYHCLVNWTGARPSEYYSMKSRPGYAEYAKKVPQFFPKLF